MFRVTKKFDLRGSETPVKSFNDEKAAIAEIQKKMAEDVLMRVTAFYCLYEGYDLMKQFDQKDLEKTTTTVSSDDSQSSSGKGSTQSFRPSPLQTSPRPAGMPASSWKKEEDDKDQDH